MHLASFLVQMANNNISVIATANYGINIQSQHISRKFLSISNLIQRIVQSLFEISFQIIVGYVGIVFLVEPIS